MLELLVTHSKNLKQQRKLSKSLHASKNYSQRDKPLLCFVFPTCSDPNWANYWEGIKGLKLQYNLSPPATGPARCGAAVKLPRRRPVEERRGTRVQRNLSHVPGALLLLRAEVEEESAAI